jgi:hypothetical protein
MLYIKRVSGWMKRKYDLADISPKAFLELFV